MNLSLVIPGLLDKRFLGHPETPSLPALPCLSRLLSRGLSSELPVGGFHALLFYLFGDRSETGHGVPVAPVTRLADSVAADCNDHEFWLRADPVHLRADQSRLVLFDASVLSISGDEASQLAEAFNEFYSARGWRLEPLHPERWYLNVVAPIRIETSPLYLVAGRDIDAFMPKGADERDWHGVMNEVQMLFHDHPVNAARSGAGKPVINSVWFWGEGLSPQPVSVDWSVVVSAEPVSQGLAVLSGVPCMARPATADEFLASQATSGNVMIVLDNLLPSCTYGDAAAWQESMLNLDGDWFEPLVPALRRGLVRQLTVYPCDGRYFRVTRAGIRRFWKRVKSLETFVAHG